MSLSLAILLPLGVPEMVSVGDGHTWLVFRAVKSLEPGYTLLELLGPSVLLCP